MEIQLNLREPGNGSPTSKKDQAKSLPVIELQKQLSEKTGLPEELISEIAFFVLNKIYDWNCLEVNHNSIALTLGIKPVEDDRNGKGACCRLVLNNVPTNGNGNGNCRHKPR